MCVYIQSLNLVTRTTARYALVIYLQRLVACQASLQNTRLTCANYAWAWIPPLLPLQMHAAMYLINWQPGSLNPSRARQVVSCQLPWIGVFDLAFLVRFPLSSQAGPGQSSLVALV